MSVQAERQARWFLVVFVGLLSVSAVLMGVRWARDVSPWLWLAFGPLVAAGVVVVFFCARWLWLARPTSPREEAR